MIEFNFKNLTIERPFQKFGDVVGFHITDGKVHLGLHFPSLRDRLETRWNEIEQEINRLQGWWEDSATPRDEATVNEYDRKNIELSAERKRIEAVWIQIKPYLENEKKGTKENGKQDQ